MRYTQQLLISFSTYLRIHLTGHAMEVPLRDINMIEKYLLGHAEIALVVVGWHAALVSPIDVYARPVQLP
jgi:hypothetical protein